MDAVSIERTCKPKGHDVDYENEYRPANTPIKIPRPEQILIDKSMLHAQKVAHIMEEMKEKTDLIYLQKEDNFYYWNPNAKVWQTDGLSYLMTLFNQTVPRVLPNKPKVFHDVIFELKIDVVTLPKNFRPKPTVLYFKNAAFDLERLQVTGKVKEDNIQIMLETELDLNAPIPKLFMDALHMALPDPQDLFDCLQALSSVLLIRTQRIEKAFFFLGSGGNGKSTIMKVLDNIFQTYMAHVDMLDLQKDGFSKTALVDKLANSFSEISKMKQKDVGVFKAIASGDIQSVNSKFKDRFDSVIKVIQFYSSNQMPEIEEVNEGFIRRAHPIEFNQKIIKKDPYIDDKLNEPEERKRVLALLVRMAKFTKHHGFIFEKTYKEKENTLLKKTNPINEFLDSGTVFRHPDYTIKKKALYKLYRAYCDSNHYTPQNPIAFSKFLTKSGLEYAGRNEDPHWLGIGLPPTPEGQKVL